MNIKQEIIDAIKIVVDSAIRKSCPQIMFGVVIAVGNSKKCTVRINQIDYELSYYGDTAPTINQKYPVFIPSGKMNLAFITT